MTVKQFFKGKAFKCILVLTCVLLVSGILLSVCWGFLEVTDEERFNRKIKTMYDGETVTSTVCELEGYTTKVEDATIQNVWYITEKNDYLVQAASRGYGGDIICWVAVTVNDDQTAVTGIRKVIKYEVKDSAELIGNIKESVYTKFSTDYVDGKKFSYGSDSSDEYISTGASYSLSAICNCVNGSVEFIKNYIVGTSVTDPYEAYICREYIDMDKTSWTVSGDVVSYTIVTKSFTANSFTITLKVGADKKVADYTIVVNGSKPKGETDYESLMDASVLDGSLFNGKELSFFTNIFGENMEYTPITGVTDGMLVTGATDKNYPSKSTYLCASAAGFALANYDVCKQAPKEVTE